MAAEGQRTARFEARIVPESLDIIRRAAEIQGRTVSDFVVAAAYEAAQRVVAEAEVVRLSRGAQESLIALLLRPPPPNDALARAFEHHRNFFGDPRGEK